MLEILNIFPTNFAQSGFSPIFFPVSFLGGVVSSISPCALGILPIIIAYVGISKEQNPFRIASQSAMLVLGLATVLTVIGVISALTGRVLGAFGGDYWVLFMASLILVFGLCLLGILNFNFPSLVKRMPTKFNNHPFIYAYIVGLMFALASTPCSTPILAGIISFASLSANLFFGALMLFLFAIGQGLVLILAALFTSLIRKLHNIDKILEIIVKLCGVVLVVAAFCIYYNVFSGLFR